ncbi:hypothetical protein [Kitasatospora sp. NPDC002965]|uniref:hypothetical protein n=1 Tax=Kitasatospora sp. NPDC002965 TaxID=3154775 RepID=UPI0033B1BEAE
MEAPVVAALIASGAALATSVLTAIVTVRNARTQAREGRRAQLDTARRNHQRGAYADLVSTTRTYLRATVEVLTIAETLDRNGSDEGLRNAKGTQVYLDADTAKNMHVRLKAVLDSSAVTDAAVLIDLEGPPAVAERAAEVQRRATHLERALETAGYLDDPGPARAKTDFVALEQALKAFVESAKAHLSSHI